MPHATMFSHLAQFTVFVASMSVLASFASSDSDVGDEPTPAAFSRGPAAALPVPSGSARPRIPSVLDTFADSSDEADRDVGEVPELDMAADEAPPGSALAPNPDPL